MMEDQIRSFLKDAGRPVTAQDISKGTKKTKREVNQVIYKMSDVKKTEDTPPKWMLRGAELPTVSASATSLDLATTKIDFATGMSFDAALSNSPSVPFFDELLKQRIRAVLNESGTTPLTAPQLARKLNDSSIKVVDVKRLLYDIATNVAPNGQKPMWILPENNTGGVTISNLPVQLAGKPLFVKEENDDQIIFTKVKDSDIVVPTTFMSNEDNKHEEEEDTDEVKLKPKLISNFSQRYVTQIRKSVSTDDHRFVIDQQHFHEALKRSGSVKTRISKAIVQGPARAGKTSVTCLILAQKYTSNKSTNCIESPRIAVGEFFMTRHGRQQDDKVQWELVDSEAMIEKFASEIRDLMAQQKKENDSQTSHTIHAHNLDVSESSPSNVSTVNNGGKELIDMVNKASGQLKKLSFHKEWLYFIDCGGQIQFQQLVQAFIPCASVLMLVINLARDLSSQCSPVFQYDEDKTYEVSEYLPTVETLLSRLTLMLTSSSFQNQLTKSHDLSDKIKIPDTRVLAIATHRDVYEEQKQRGEEIETIDMKEQKLFRIFKPIERNLSYFDGKILHEVDGRKATQGVFDDLVIKEICDELREQAFEVTIPLSWYAFEILLHQVALKSHGVLSLNDCEATGLDLGLNKDAVHSALKFFHLLNTILYYPGVSNLVFANPESLIDVIRELLVFVCEKRKKKKTGRVTLEIIDFVEKGVVSKKVLSKCSELFKSDNDLDFSSQLLQIFKHLLIVAEMAEEKFFMPALLPLTDPSQTTCSPFSLVYYFEKGVPLGLFCVMIVNLFMSEVDVSDQYDDYIWKIDDKSTMFSNCVTLKNFDMKGRKVVFIESNDCFEIHFECAEDMRKGEKIIYSKLIDAINKRNFDSKVNPKKAVYCQCGKQPHHVAILRKSQNSKDASQTTRCTLSDVIIDEHLQSSMPSQKDIASEIDDISTHPLSSVEVMSYQSVDLLHKQDDDTEKMSVLLDSIKAIFEGLTEISVDTTGLIYHSSQYGITLIVPEGAVETKAKIFIGINFVSNKFKFEDDFVPVSPIVWAYTNSQLIKPAELYIPHHIDISNMKDVNNQLYLLTADDESFLRDKLFTFKINQEIKITVESMLAKFSPPHFCSNCIGVKGQAYREIPKQYLIAKAERRLPDYSMLVDLCFLFEQKICKEKVENQYKTLDHSYILKFLPATIVSQAHLSLSFDPDPTGIPGWSLDRELYYEYITEEMIDYYKVFTEGGEDGLERLKMREDALLFPPRYQLKFKLIDSLVASKNYTINIKFIGTKPTIKTTVLLENPNGPPYTQLISSPLPSTLLPDISKDVDPYLACVIDMILAEPLMKDKWFHFGYELSISVNQLSTFECRIQNYTQCTREVIIFWRKKNMSETWIPVAQALHFAGLHTLEEQIIQHFANEYTDKLKDYKLCPVSHGRSPEPNTPLQKVISSCENNKEASSKDKNNIQLILDKKPNKAYVVDLLAKNAHQYKRFATKLGVESGFARGLSGDDNIEKLDEIIDHWMTTRSSPVTWRTIIEAVESDTLDNNIELADKIRNWLEKDENFSYYCED